MIAAAGLIVVISSQQSAVSSQQSAVSSQQSAVSEPKRDLLGNQEPLQNA